MPPSPFISHLTLGLLKVPTLYFCNATDSDMRPLSHPICVWVFNQPNSELSLSTQQHWGNQYFSHFLMVMRWKPTLCGSQPPPCSPFCFSKLVFCPTRKMTVLSLLLQNTFKSYWPCSSLPGNSAWWPWLRWALWICYCLRAMNYIHNNCKLNWRVLQDAWRADRVIEVSNFVSWAHILDLSVE